MLDTKLGYVRQRMDGSDELVSQPGLEVLQVPVAERRRSRETEVCSVHKATAMALKVRIGSSDERVDCRR